MRSGMASLELSDDQLKQLVAAAVLAELTPERREVLIKDAIASLLAVPAPQGSWDKNPKSPLQHAFEQGVAQVAREIVRDTIKDDPRVVDVIKSLVEQVVTKLANHDDVGAQTLDRVAELIAKPFVDAARHL